MKVFLLFCFLSTLQALYPSPLRAPQLLSKLAQSNYSIALARLDYQLAKAEKKGGLSPFDPRLGFGIYREYEKEETNSVLDNEVKRTKTNGLSLGLEKTLSFGTEVSASFQSLKIKDDSINAISPMRNQMAFVANLEIPVLKNAGITTQAPEYVKADFKIERYRQDFLDTVGEKYQKMTKSYLKCLELYLRMQLRQEELIYYSNLDKFTQKAYKLGSKSKIDALDTSSQLTRTKALLTQDISDLKKEQLELFKFLGDQTEIDFNDKISIKKNPFLSISFNPSNVLRSARLESLKQRTEEIQVEKENEKNQALPKLNLNLGFQSSALGDSEGQGFERLTNVNHPQWTFGFTFNWDFGSIHGKGKFNAKKKALAQKNWEIRKSLHEQRAKLSELIKKRQDYQTLLDLNNDRLKLEEKKIDLFKKQFKLGIVSFLDLKKALNDYRNFKISHRRQLFDLYISEVEIANLTGQLNDLYLQFI